MSNNNQAQHHQMVHAVHNAAADTAGSQITAALTKPVDWKFSFKKQTVTSDVGQPTKRPPVTLTVPVPTLDGLLTAMSNAKVQSYILDLVEEAIKDRVRVQLSDDDKPVNRQDDLDLHKLTLEYIADIPKTERTGTTISKEDWEAWMSNYILVMSPERGVEKATTAAKTFAAKFAPARGKPEVIKFLHTQLLRWAEAADAEALENFGEIFTYLDAKASAMLKAAAEVSLDAL